MNNYKIMAGLLGLALTAVTAQAAAPSLSYEVNGNEFIINYTGTLYQSTDAVSWTAVASASSPYKVQIGNNQQFFCAKASDEPIDPLSPGKNGRISLPGGVALDMNWIEPGTFLMGSPTNELGRYDSETQHQVTLTQGYWLGKYEVTQAQYEAVMGTNPSNWKGADLPVEMVRWNDATNFCAKLTAIERAAGRLPEGYEYTLPTEAQWEYACRSGTTTALNSGKNLSDKYECPEMDEVGWYWCNSGSKTHPVGQKQPNAWGLYDMHGNVFEWCLDRYGAYPASSVTDPTGASTGSHRVRRGGSWYAYADGCRSARRDNYNPVYFSNYGGFRVVLSPVQSESGSFLSYAEQMSEVLPEGEQAENGGPLAASGAMSPSRTAVAAADTLTYQWYKDGKAISGATASSYTIKSVQASDAGSYTVTVSKTPGDCMTCTGM